MTEEVRETEQPAVAEEPKVAPNEAATAESGAAQNDGLDDLLKEFDARREEAEAPRETVRTSEPKPETPIDTVALAQLEQRLNQQEAREQRRELEKMLDRFTDGVQADAVEAEAFLIAQAKRDNRIETAYLNRGKNPKLWGDIESALKRDFAKRWGKKVDRQVTDSRDAVSAAVRSASTAAPQNELSAADIMNASKEEFDSMQRKLGVIPA